MSEENENKEAEFTCNTGTPETPETDAPETPETDAPETPETDAPETPETDAQETLETKTRCTCGQSLSYVDRQNGVCPCCGESLG